MNRWMWLLIGFGHHGYILEGEVCAGMGKLLLPPRLGDNVQRFEKAAATLIVGHIVSLVVPGQAAASDPKVKAPLADVVHRRSLLSDAQRIGQRQDLHRQPNAYLVRTGGDGAGNDYRRR